MRRPRSKLQVSTFPFLAVLLCAMGSLLLFLFIMDRRAKIAARNQAMEAHAALAARKAESQADRDKRQAEWEQAKEKLHQSLLQQEQELAAASQEIQQNLDTVNKKQAALQVRYLETTQKVQSAAATITTMQNQLDQERNEIQSSEKKASASQAELLQASAELAELNQALQQLRARRQSDKATYSVVPYRGKREDMRPPIYVECVREGVLFQPEKKLLRSGEFTMAELVREVERQAGPLAVAKAPKQQGGEPRSDTKTAYVLFLIRPEGISNYYHAQGLLRGYQLDFGYELVDEHWVLDFSATTGPPPKTALTPPVPAPLIPAPLKQIASPPLLPELSPQGIGNVKDTMPPLPVGPAFPSSGTSSVGSSLGNPGGAGSVTPVRPAAPIALPGSGPSIGNPVGGIGSLPPLEGNAPSSSKSGASTNREPAFIPVAKLNPAVPVASTEFKPRPIAASSTQAANSGAFSTNGSNTGGNPSTIGTGIPAAIGTPIPGNSVSGKRPDPNATPVTLESSGTQGTSGAPGTTAMQGNLSKSAAGSANPPSGDSLPGNFGGSPQDLSVGTAAPNKPASAPMLSRVLGNRDFIISIDCHADHVTVFPSGRLYRWPTQNMQAQDQALVQNVATLVERRQASVRPGEPPYRPIIRFQVSAEGLRTYYHVYPLLDHLRIPMTRENVED